MVTRTAADGDRVALGDVGPAVAGATPTRVTRVRVEHPGEGRSGGDRAETGDGTE